MINICIMFITQLPW